jgi:hypothetical protein
MVGLLVNLQGGEKISMQQKKMQCTVLAGSMQYGSANIRQWRVVAVVPLFVSLQGRPPNLDAEKEGATSPDRSSLVAHTRRR